MKSKSKCPICKNNLHKINIVVSTCTNDKCKLWGSSIPNLVLDALTQAKQDLEIATKANDEIRGEYETYHGAEREGCFTINWEVVAKKMYNYANTALKQIEHKE